MHVLHNGICALPEQQKLNCSAVISGCSLISCSLLLLLLLHLLIIQQPINPLADWKRIHYYAIAVQGVAALPPGQV
jgi:hypothetical protein